MRRCKQPEFLPNVSKFSARLGGITQIFHKEDLVIRFTFDFGLPVSIMQARLWIDQLISFAKSLLPTHQVPS